MPALTQYKLPMKAAPRSMDGGELFKALQKGMVTMIVARATDGKLTQETWKALRDDRNRFCAQAGRVAGAGQPAGGGTGGCGRRCNELSGKFNIEKMRKLNAQVDLEHLQPKDVAASFLMESGLR